MSIAATKKRTRWQRARRPEEQEERRAEILEAAYALFRDLEYEEVSLNAIARETGLSKSSIYLYFSTREEIFLHIFMDAFRLWGRKTLRNWASLGTRASVERLAAAWVGAAWKNERLVALAPLLGTSIERHVSAERLAACVRMKQEVAADLAVALRERGHEVTAEVLFGVLLSVFILMGQYMAYERNDALCEVLKQPTFKSIDQNYEQVVARQASHLLRAVLEKRRVRR